MPTDPTAARSARAIESVSVLIPTHQGAAFLERLLSRLSKQLDAPPWDLSIVDSSSSDGSDEIFRRHSVEFPVPMRVSRIHPDEFNHGDTRNQLAANSTGDLLVFLSQDAMPADAHWLAKLVRNFDDPRVGAAYSRNIPHPDADPTTKLLCRDDPGYAEARREVTLPDAERYAAMNPHERREFYNFNNVASAIRRSVWQRHPFPRANFGEDILIARAILEAGHTIVFDPDAPVEHSHDYDTEQLRARAYVDGRFNAEWLGRECIASERDVRLLEERFARTDAIAIRELAISQSEVERMEARAGSLRRATFRGLYEGGAEHGRGRSGVRPATAMLDAVELDILYVVHGFPPDSWAGTEVYTLNLAREMRRRGHRVTVMTRVDPGPNGKADFAVTEKQFAGLRVLEVNNGLDHSGIEGSYRDSRAEGLLRRLLEDEPFDVVHFQHLIHASIGMVDVAKRAGVATVIHCHDYWPLCARVQMIRPDGVRCEREMGLGCHACVKNERLDAIEKWEARTQAVGPLLDVAARVATHSFFGKRTNERAKSYSAMRERGPAIRAAFAANDLALVPSRFLRDRLLASGAFDPEHLVYSPNGVHVDAGAGVDECADPTRRLRIGYVGTLAWYKGVDVLLRAVARMSESRVRLSIFGDFRPESDAYHASMKEIAMPNVQFCGAFDNARLADIHANLDVLVVPSIWFENAPVTIHEAFASGTPVVVSDIGGMAECVENGGGGLQFATGNPEALAQCLERFVSEPGLSKELAMNAPVVKTIVEDAALTEARYRALCSRHRTRGVAR